MTPAESAAPETESPTLVTLYVVGDSPDSATALVNVRFALDALPEGRTPTLKIVDVSKYPLEALREGVFVTPTLLLEHLGKRSTMYGDLSNAQRVDAFFASVSS